MPKARAAAERALAIDSNLGLAEVVLGEVAQFFDYDLTAAARHSERAIALDPNNHYVHQGLGFLHAARGQFGPAVQAVQAVQAVKQACAIDPLNRTVYGYGAIVHMAARTPEEAVRLADQAVDLDPHYWDSLRLAGWAHLFLGDRPGAVSRLDRALVLSQPHPFVTLMHGTALGGEAARKAAADLSDRHAKGEPVHAFAVAISFAVAGNLELAVQWFERAAEGREFWLAIAGASPDFDPLRGHPRFKAVCRRLGLPALALEILARPRPRWWESIPAAAEAPERSIVVLPFENANRDLENAYFADGLTDELISDLSKLQALRVIARTSSNRLKGTAKDLSTIGRGLGVRHVLSGAVRRAGDALRITA